MNEQERLFPTIYRRSLVGELKHISTGPTSSSR